MNGRTLLLAVPANWAPLWTIPLTELAPGLNIRVEGKDAYDPETIDYVLSFRPAPGLLKGLSNLRVAFSLGAGVDGFLSDPQYPKHVPLVRFVGSSLADEMAEFCVLHVLMHYRMQRFFDRAQGEHKWRQTLLPRRAEDIQIGILGFGEIGAVVANRLQPFGFRVAGWSRTHKHIEGVESFAGEDKLPSFLARSDFLICLLPLTPQTRGILNASLFAQLPKDAFVINVARGGHLVDADLIAALDSGQLSGAVLDVFHREPLPEDHPFWSHPKITVTPHIAAITDPRAAISYVANGIARFERGEGLENVADLNRGY
jgi:glyoxylate/hydroxypyruvate reductase A